MLGGSEHAFRAYRKHVRTVRTCVCASHRQHVRKRCDPPSSRHMSGTRRHGTCFRCDAQRMFGQSQHAYGRLGTHVRTFPTCFKCANARSDRPNMRCENVEACSSNLNMRSTGKSMFLLCEPARVYCKRMFDAPDMRACFSNACSDVSNMRSTRKTHVRGV